jgi:hypothetical protein
MSHLDVRPCLLVTTRHDAGAVTGTLFSSGYTGSDESDTLLREVLGTAVRVRVVGVTTVDDDITLLGATLEEELDEVVDGLTRHDEHHHAARLLELRNELLDGVSADNGFALGLCDMLAQKSSETHLLRCTIVQESVDLGNAVCLSMLACFCYSCGSLRSVEGNDLRPR